MDPETQAKFAEIERQLELLRDHEHTGVDFKQIQSSNVSGSSNASARLTLGSSQSIPDTTPTLADFSVQTYSYGITVSITDKSCTIITNGRYLIIGSLDYGATQDQRRYVVAIYKNGSAVSHNLVLNSGTIRTVTPCVTDILDLVAGDIITIYAVQVSSVTETLQNAQVIAGTGIGSFFSISKL